MTALDPRALEAALLPCPFCGGTMQLRFALWPAEGDRDAVIHAAPTNCPIEGAFCIDTDDDGVSVAEAWNRRATLPAAPATGSVGEDATLTFANGEAYGLTMDQGRRAIAAALQADTIPSAIDGAIKGMRVLRTMLNSRGLGGADVAEAIIADLERMNADPAAVPAPPVQEPVAWLRTSTALKEIGEAFSRYDMDPTSRDDEPFVVEVPHRDGYRRITVCTLGDIRSLLATLPAAPATGSVGEASALAFELRQMADIEDAVVTMEGRLTNVSSRPAAIWRRAADLLSTLPPAPAGSAGEDNLWREMVQAHASAMRMVIDAIEHLFGPAANMESEDASLLRGPEPHHRAEGVIEALQRIANALSALPAPPAQEPTRDALKAREAEIVRDYTLGNLTPLGVANYLRRAGFNLQYAVDRSNALAPTSTEAEAVVPEGGWQPIETAPKDGKTEILVFTESPDGAQMQQVACWEGGEYAWNVNDGSAYHKDLFTHWRPLPAPPQPQETKP